MLVSLIAAAAMASASHSAPDWAVDKAASRLGFTASMNAQPFQGAFRTWDAQIAFDPADLPASHVTAVIDVASAGTGDATRDEAMPTGDWFSAKAFPRATFRSRRIVSAGPGRYVAEGDLTIRNLTRPVSLPFTLAITGPTAKMSGSVPIDRSAFGVGQGQWSTGDAVALKVVVNIAITAHRAK